MEGHSSDSLTHIFQAGAPPKVLIGQVLEAVGTHLRADRCFLYVRDPVVEKGRIAFCWRKDDTIPNPIHDWQVDTGQLPAEDPLIRAALADKPSVFVDDVETAPAEVLNRDFEHRTFGHRALIHAHITENGQLWGILQPCLFGQPRHWTDADRTFIRTVLPKLLPVIKQYVQQVTID